MPSENYGSIKDEKEKFVTCEIRMNEFAFFPHNPFKESFNEDFWCKVHEVYKDGTTGKSWHEALTQVRLELICQRLHPQDVIVSLMEDTFDLFKEEAIKRDALDFMPSFIQQLSEFVVKILMNDERSSRDKDKKPTYSKLLKCCNSKKTVLHLAAERNLTFIAKEVLTMYPGQCYVKTSGGDQPKQIPLEMALTNSMDDVGCMLVKAMLNERVRQLFEFDEVIQRAKFSFCHLSQNVKMKKTVMAILDCLMNPDYPYSPIPPGEESGDVWSKIPDMPMRYHVNYCLIDGDTNGRHARVFDKNSEKLVDNNDFDHRTQSGLFLIVHSPFNQDLISHPTIQILVRKKWNLYGRKLIRVQAFMYIVYLILMSVALFLHVPDHDRTGYKLWMDYFRGVCEVLTCLMAFVQILSELDEMFKEGKIYWMDVYNVFDLLGIGLIFMLPVLKFTTVDSVTGEKSSIEWIIASLAFLVNFLRIFKYFPASKALGVYSKTFAEILYYDITKFFTIYIVVMVAFSGSVYLALMSYKDGLERTNLSLSLVFFQEIRALTEAQGFAEDYDLFRVGVVVLLMVNMFVIIVLLTNVLIGQISYRYENALANAQMQYHIDKTKIVTRVENSRWRSLNQRIRHYTPGDYINGTRIVEGIVDDYEVLARSATKPKNAESTVMAMMCDMVKLKKQ